MKTKSWIHNTTDGSKIYFNKKSVAREISKMPYFQVHYTQSMIIEMIDEENIHSSVIAKAINNIK